MKLIKYEAMCRAIDAAHKVDEVKEIRDRAAALEHYARQAQNTEAERRAAQIRMRAERKAGQLLAKMDKLKGRPSKKGLPPVTLSDLGITKRQSMQWQQLGALSDNQFELAIGTKVLPPSTKKPAPYHYPVPTDALWLWGRLLDFERNGTLDKSPVDMVGTMSDAMRQDVVRLVPKVIAWLERIGEVTWPEKIAS